MHDNNKIILTWHAVNLTYAQLCCIVIICSLPPSSPPAPSARYVSAISSHSALHGLSLLSLFIYVYTANASFPIVSCRVTDKGYVRSGIAYCFPAQMKNEGSHHILVLHPSIVMYCTYTLPLLSCKPQSV